MYSVSLDTTEVRLAVRDMSNIDNRLRPDVASVVKRGANNIKDDMLTQMRNSKHFKGFTGISYDMKDDFEAWIGPDKGGPGAGANLAYFGTSRGGGTVEDPEETMERKLPAFEEHLADIAARSVFP